MSLFFVFVLLLTLAFCALAVNVEAIVSRRETILSHDRGINGLLLTAYFADAPALCTDKMRVVGGQTTEFILLRIAIQWMANHHIRID